MSKGTTLQAAEKLRFSEDMSQGTTFSRADEAF